MNTLKAEKRNAEDKAKRLRREGYIVGSVCGREMKDSLSIKMDKKEAESLLRSEGKGGHITLFVDGAPVDALIKEISYDYMKKEIMDIEFQALVKGEKVHSVAEIVIENREAVKAGVLEELVDEIAYKALPSALIEKVKIDVSSLRIGDAIRVKDLEIAKNPDIELITHPDTVLVEVTASRNTGEEETAAETADGDAKDKK